MSPSLMSFVTEIKQGGLFKMHGTININEASGENIIVCGPEFVVICWKNIPVARHISNHGLARTSIHT